MLTYEEVVRELHAYGDPWQAQPDPFANISRTRLRRRLGYRRAPGELTREEAEERARSQRHDRTPTTRYPMRRDLRDVGGRNFVTPVHDQGECAACVAFGSLATLEATIQYQRHDPALDLDFSEAHLFHCTPGCLKCAFGWQIPLAIERLTKDGVLDDARLHYEPRGGCRNLPPDWATHVTKIQGWEKLTDLADMKSWLADRGALIATMTVYEDFHRYYKSGPYRHVAGTYSGDHCVCCIGFDDTPGAQYWICKNSWGTKWGTGGFFTIAYGERGIGSEMWGLVP